MADIFILTDEENNLLPPLKQACVLAKYCRSNVSAKNRAIETSIKSAEEFQNKWVVEYGHNSVAELATLPTCFEGVSIVASKFLESLPRPACAEKSTRALKFTVNDMYWPSDNMRKAYGSLITELFDLYEEVYEYFYTCLQLKQICSLGACSTQAYDIARYILPAGTKTSLSLVANLRDISELVQQLLSSNNEEFKNIGSTLVTAALPHGGPLIRHSHAEPWLSNWHIKPSVGTKSFVGVRVADFTPIKKFEWEELVKQKYWQNMEFFEEAMQQRPLKAKVPGIFRRVSVGFEVRTDYGAFRDLQRHRNMLQEVEPLTTNYGYVVPTEIKNSHFYTRYAQIMQKVKEQAPLAGWFAPYITPLAYIHSSYYKMDLQQLYYLTELRTQPSGHISYKKVAWDMAYEAYKLYPYLMKWCRAIDPATGCALNAGKE